MSFLIPLIAIFIAVFFVAGRRVDRDGLVSPLTILAFSMVFYYVTVPVELRLRNQTLVGFTGFHMTSGTGDKILWMTLLGIIALGIGYNFVAARESLPAYTHATPPEAARRARQVALVVTLLGALLLATVFRNNVIASTDYLSNVSQTSAEAGNVGYFIANRWTYLSFAIFAFLTIASAKRAWLAAFCVLPLVAWSIFTNDKDPLLAAALAVTALLQNRQSAGSTARSGWSVIAVCVGGLATFGLGALVYGENRAGGSLSATGIRSLINEGVFTNIDPAGPSAVLSVELSNPGGQGSIAPTLLAPFSWIPSPPRPFSVPTDLAVTFAQTHWSGWKPGFGYGYSPIAEGWQGMGTLGVVSIFFGIGVFFALVRNWLLDEGARSTSTSWLKLGGYHILVSYLAFVSMRGTLTSMFSTAFIVLTLLACLIVLTHLVEPDEKALA